MSLLRPRRTSHAGFNLYRFLTLLVLTVVSAIALSWASVQAQTPSGVQAPLAPAVQTQPPVGGQTTTTPAVTTPPAPTIGFLFEGSRTLNAIALTTQQFTGQCAGTEEPTVRAWFTSSTTPPADDRRVLIRNVTPGMDPSDYPYTNRKYEDGAVSDSTTMEFGSDHSRTRFRVAPGENQFEYTITDDDDRVLESGTFTANIQNVTTTQDRPATCRRERVCFNSSVSTSSCADLRWRNQCSCPNGSVVSTQWETQGAVRTLISNQSRQGVTFQLGGRRYYLNSGEDRWLSGDNLGSVQFDQGNNRGDRTMYLTPGTRYRFNNDGSGGISLSVWNQ